MKSDFLRFRRAVCGLIVSATVASGAIADVRVPSIFGSNMVLQRDQANPVWGWADPGEEIAVTIADQTKKTTADDKGNWRVSLDPLTLGDAKTLVIEGKNRLEFGDVLIGEVWLCSGQSNMQWAVEQSNDADLEQLTANYPHIRLISVPRIGTQEPQDDFEGQWQQCTSDTVGSFSAVGYFFGRQLHQSLGVPIGLIDNSWGGSSCEAWIRRDLLEKDEAYKPLLERWSAEEASYEKLSAVESKDDNQAKQLANLKKRMTGQHRPGNLYAGVLHPILGFGIRGAIWYQGESNASRAYQYRDMFPLMIQSWRDEWKQGDFPFYWVQLADFRDEVDEPTDSDWAELREAQTMTMDRLPNTGEAVIIDIGEGRDIHPRNKQDVAKRLSRWALAKDYGLSIDYQSPRYQSMKTEGNKITLSFDPVGTQGLYTFDVKRPIGFTIAGSDQKFVDADAKLVGKNQIVVWSDQVSEPVAVRYAWAANPVANVTSRNGLPVTPFRTDDWKGVTADAK